MDTVSSRNVGRNPNLSQYRMLFLGLLAMLVISTSVIITRPYPLVGHLERLQKTLGLHREHLYWASPHDGVVHIAFTSCGVRKDESFVLVKSALLLTNTTLFFHIFAELRLQDAFAKALHTMKRQTGIHFYFRIYDLSFPNTGRVSSDTWRQLFAPCASQRLFYHILMKDIDAVLYVDTDTLFLSPPGDAWSLFNTFNSSQLVGMVPEQLGVNFTNSWYEQFKDTPHYGAKGVNSGVMLMNLTRIRAQHWEDKLANLLVNHKAHIRLGDQDLLNIYFYYNPEFVKVIPCEFNYRVDFCDSDVLTCGRPAKIIHGNRGVWHSAEQPSFKAIYDVFEQLVDPENLLPMIVEANLNSGNETWCDRRSHLFVDELYKRLT